MSEATKKEIKKLAETILDDFDDFIVVDHMQDLIKEKRPDMISFHYRDAFHETAMDVSCVTHRDDDAKYSVWAKDGNKLLFDGKYAKRVFDKCMAAVDRKKDEMHRDAVIEHREVIERIKALPDETNYWMRDEQ